LKEGVRNMVERIEKHLHYLKVLQMYYGHMQPEIRDAIDYAVECVERDSKIEKI
jgi:hypothetical protein